MTLAEIIAAYRLTAERGERDERAGSGFGTVEGEQGRRLADALTEIDRRLRVLEPCANRAGEPHEWLSYGGPCSYCGITRGER